MAEAQGARSRRPSRTGAALALCLLALACLGPGRALAAQVTYVDCQASPAGADGSVNHPLTTLAEASAVPLGPGSQLLLKRGTSCQGLLAPTGSGSAGAPAAIDVWGEGPAPAIEGTGEDAVRLTNTAHLTLRGLAVSNPGDGSGRKRGVHLVADGAEVEGLTVAGLTIRDVGGNLDKDGGGSGGIQADAADGGRFPGLEIRGNRIEDVSRSGIFVIGTAGGARPRAGQPWPEASPEVVIEENAVARVAGDGIVVLGTDGAVLRGNLVERGNLAGRSPYDPAGMICNAGIWAFNANGTVIERNEVARMSFNGCDGTAFDVDYEQDGTTIRFNYSHDNEGGFLLLCTDSEPRLADAAFNLSVNDAYMLQSSPCNRVTGNYSGVRVFNNTVVAPDPSFAVLGNPSRKLFGPQDLALFNNLVAATGPARGFECGPACSHNLFSGLPAAGSEPVRADPGFVTPGPWTGGESAAHIRLAAGSAALRAGLPVPAGAAFDYFGTPIPADRPANVGFDQHLPGSARPARLRALRLKPRRFRPLRGRGPALGRRGARLSFRTNTAGRVIIRIAGLGRRRALGGVIRRGVPVGPTVLRLTGRLNRRPLRPGRYRLTIRLKAAGAVSPARTLRLRIRR